MRPPGRPTKEGKLQNEGLERQAVLAADEFQEPPPLI